MIAAPVLSNDRPDLPARCYLERAIVANLIAHLQAAGFQPYKASDGEEQHRVSNVKEAMEVIFSVDESWLYVKHAQHPKGFAIMIVLGNGEDCIADHAAPVPDPAGFVAVMEQFYEDVLPGIVSGEALHKALAERQAECEALTERLDAVTHNETELRAALRAIVALLNETGEGGDGADWVEAVSIADRALA